MGRDKASGLSHEEVREVGILKIPGWQTCDLIFLRFSKSSIVALFAFLCSSLLAWVHVVYFEGTLFRTIFLGWSVIRPTEEYGYIGYPMYFLLITATFSNGASRNGPNLDGNRTADSSPVYQQPIPPF